MRCPEYGASGYSSKTKSPEWRCSKCGCEWDGLPGYDDTSFESGYTGLSTQQRLDNLGGLIAVGLFIAAIVGVLISAIVASTG